MDGNDGKEKLSLDERLRASTTPRMVENQNGERINPVSEDTVVQETDGIFRSFVQNMQLNEVQLEEADETPSFNELAFGVDPHGPFSKYSQVGKRLATIGDQINSRYTPEFDSMIKMLNPSMENIKEVFVTVADRLFSDGQIHWGRIITLLCFGYRLAVTILKKGIGGFFASIITYLIDYLVMKKIHKWIAERGGWRAVMNLIPETGGWAGIAIVFSLAVVSLSTAVYLSNNR